MASNKEEVTEATAEDKQPLNNTENGTKSEKEGTPSVHLKKELVMPNIQTLKSAARCRSVKKPVRNRYNSKI